MKKRFLAIFCALALLLGAVPSAAALEGESARSADTLVTLDLLDSSENLTATATRAQAALLVVRLAGAEKAALAIRPVTLFRDLPAWSYPAVTYAVQQGWFRGVNTNEFHPANAITANAWFTALLRMLGYSDQNGDFTVDGAALFARHIGLTSLTYSGELTRGQMYQSAVEALSFSYKGSSSTVLQKLVGNGVVPRSAANALGLLTPELTARQIADRRTAAVFCIAGYDSDTAVFKDESDRSASGFFISPDGLAVTNCHSIAGSLKATATLSTGECYPIESVLWYDQDIDLAVIRVSRTSTQGVTTSAFSCMELAGADDIRTGDTVYAISNPLGLGLAVSSGIISDTASNADSYALPCIVSSADISQGSSGGALMNAYGHVIGVTSGAYTYGNSMFLAVPVDTVMALDLNAVKPVTLMEMAAALLETK